MVSINQEQLLVYVIRNYGGRMRSGKLLAAVIETYYPWLLESVKQNKCPFCGRVFSSRRSLEIHFKLTKNCKQQLWSIAEDIFDKYSIAKQYIRKYKYTKVVKVYRVTIENPAIRVSTLKEAIQLLRKRGYLP